MPKYRWFLAAAALIPLLSQASPITYDFTVTAGSGPLNGQTASGFLTYDSSIVPTGGGTASQAGLITDLSFTWDGITYDETTANTGGLAFDAAGTPVAILFGTNCGAGACGLDFSKPSWFVSDTLFSYNGLSPGSGTASFTLRSEQVPEPASLALAGLALAAAAATSRARRRAA